MYDRASLYLCPGKFTVHPFAVTSFGYKVIHTTFTFSITRIPVLHMSKPIPGAPGHKFYAGATYMPGRFTLNVNMQSVFDLYTDAEYSKKEDFTTLNAKVAYRFGTRDKGLNLFVKGENLTATRYTINDGFPMPKAIFMGGIDVTF